MEDTIDARLVGEFVTEANSVECVLVVDWKGKKIVVERFSVVSSIEVEEGFGRGVLCVV